MEMKCCRQVRISYQPIYQPACNVNVDAQFSQRLGQYMRMNEQSPGPSGTEGMTQRWTGHEH